MICAVAFFGALNVPLLFHVAGLGAKLAILLASRIVKHLVSTTVKFVAGAMNCSGNLYETLQSYRSYIRLTQGLLFTVTSDIPTGGATLKSY